MISEANKALDVAFCNLIDEAVGKPLLFSKVMDEISSALDAVEKEEMAKDLHTRVLEHTLKSQDTFLCEYMDAYKAARAEYFINVSERGTPALTEFFKRFE